LLVGEKRGAVPSEIVVLGFVVAVVETFVEVAGLAVLEGRYKVGLE
jgi:hypothetical protein